MMCRWEKEDCGNMPVTPDGKLALKESMRRKTNLLIAQVVKNIATKLLSKNLLPKTKHISPF